MSTRKTKTSKAKPHSKKRGKGKGLKGPGAKKAAAVKKGMSGEVAKPIGVIVGLVGSALIGHGLDKIPFLQSKDGSEPGIAKKLIKPVALLAVGGTGVYLTHGKKGAAMEFANGVSWGIAGGGVVSGAKVFLKKDIFSGLGKSSELESKAKEAEYYKSQSEDIAKQLELANHKIELPEFSSANNAGDAMNGAFQTELDVNAMQSVL